jgi:hypothetical protein
MKRHDECADRELMHVNPRRYGFKESLDEVCLLGRVPSCPR